MHAKVALDDIIPSIYMSHVITSVTEAPPLALIDHDRTTAWVTMVIRGEKSVRSFARIVQYSEKSRKPSPP